MAYSTRFDGAIRVDPPLQAVHREYLAAFAATRRVRRDPAMTAARPDPRREAAGLAVGVEGGYFVGAGGMLGQEGGGQMFDPGGAPAESLGVLDFNAPPEGQPHAWCCWSPLPDGSGLHVVDEGAHYAPLAWLDFLSARFLGPWGYRLGGEVRYRGADPADAGRILVRDGLATFEPADGRAPQCEGWAQRERGESLFEAERWPEALAAFQGAIERAPGWPDTWWLQGMTLGRLGRLDECFACLDKSLALEHDAGRREVRRARLQALLRQTGRAPQGLERARTLRAQSRFDEAILEYRAFRAALPQAQRFGDEGITAALGIGLCEQGAHRYDEALAAYFEVAQHVPQNPSGWTYMGYLQAYQLGKPGEAVTSFELAIAAGNDGSPICNELGMAHARSGAREAARDAFIAATNADPDDPLAWFNLAHSFLALDDPGEAIGCFERAATYEDPRCHAAVLEGLAEARKRLGGA